jgi:hypothetical protein
MSYGLVLLFDGVTERDYWTVNEELGIDQNNTDNWPDGIHFHTAGPTENGGWMVVELWESKAHQEAFMGGSLGAALARSGVKPPSQIIETNTVNDKYIK